jgi:hypothetical protein
LAGIAAGSIEEEEQRRREPSLLELLCGLAQIDPDQELPADYAQE